MIRFHSVRIKNFRSYKQETLFIFNKDFNFISGDTGAGKSSIFRAVIWALNGVDSEGIKGINLKSWNSKGACVVKLKFSINNTKYELIRQQGPNKLTINQEAVEQQYINDLFGFNVNLFNYILFMSQFSDQFIHATSTDKLNLFTTILELEKWDEYSNIAKEKVSNIEKDIQDSLINKSRLDGKLESLKNSNFDKEIKQFDIDKNNQTKELNSDKKRIEKQIKTDNIKLEKLTYEYNELVEKYNSIETNEDEINDVIEELNDITKFIIENESDLKSLKHDINYLSNRIEDLNKEYAAEVNNLQSNTDTTCVTCGQKITKNCIDDQIKTLKIKLDAKVKSLTTKLKENKEEYSDLNRDLNQTKEEKSDIESRLKSLKEQDKDNQIKLQDINNQVDNKNNQIGNLNRDIKDNERELSYINKQLNDLFNKSNPYLNKQNQVNQEIENLKDEYEELLDKIDDLEIKKSNNDFWRQAFKEIKLHITEESIKEFNFFCNDNLNKLDLIGWEIENSIDKVLKSGKIKKGFTTVIKTPENDKEMPLAVYSGGEHQRIKLAVVFALIDFLNSRISINIEVYDEPTQWLNDQGIDKLLDILEGRAQHKGVYIIDHRDFKSKGCFDNVYDIIKTNNGSKIEKL